MYLKILVVSLILGLFASCAILDQAVKDPNSSLNRAVDATEPVAVAVRDTAPAAGPYGWIAGLVATIVTGGIGTYKNYRKGVVIQEKDQQYEQMRQITKAIVDSIEAVGKIPLAQDVAPSRDGTMGGAVKVKVAEALHTNGLDVIGKAVIDELKARQEGSTNG